MPAKPLRFRRQSYQSAGLTQGGPGCGGPEGGGAGGGGPGGGGGGPGGGGPGGGVGGGDGRGLKLMLLWSTTVDHPCVGPTS